MTGFRWYNRCPICSTKITAETQLVLGKKIDEHLEKCRTKALAKIDKAEAASVQRSLFDK